MWIVCIDLESVLIPELWPAIGEAFGISDLMLTTRQIGDKKQLNALRLKALQKNGITLEQVQKVISRIQPLKGAPEFLRWLSARMSVVIVSDCFRGLAEPLLKKLGSPAIICHEWQTKKIGAKSKKTKFVSLPLRVTGDSKAPVVRSFQKLGLKVVAIGDSLNDLGMLKAADAASWFRPSPRAFAQGKKIPVSQSYAQLKQKIAKL